MQGQDTVGRLDERTSLVAACDWRDEYLTSADLSALRRVAARVGGADDTPAVLFARRGFDAALVAQARNESILLVTPEEMFAPAVVGIFP